MIKYHQINNYMFLMLSLPPYMGTNVNANNCEQTQFDEHKGTKGGETHRMTNTGGTNTQDDSHIGRWTQRGMNTSLDKN